MNKLSVFLFALFFSLQSFAELTPREKTYRDLITKGDLRSLRNGAKEIYNARISNPELIDVAAEILLRKYADASDREIDTLSWLSLAVGQSGNGRYYGVLNEVADNSAQKKLRRNAKKALKSIEGPEGQQYTKGMAQLSPKIHSNIVDPKEEEKLIADMTKGELRLLKSSAKKIIDKRVKSEKVLDVGSEILLQMHETAYDSQLDSLAWLARAIGESKNGRYYDVLSTVREYGAHKKLRSHARKALKTLGPAEGAQYKAGMVKVAAKDYF